MICIRENVYTIFTPYIYSTIYSTTYVYVFCFNSHAANMFTYYYVNTLFFYVYTFLLHLMKMTNTRDGRKPYICCKQVHGRCQFYTCSYNYKFITSSGVFQITNVCICDFYSIKLTYFNKITAWAGSTFLGLLQLLQLQNCTRFLSFFSKDYQNTQTSQSMEFQCNEMTLTKLRAVVRGF